MADKFEDKRINEALELLNEVAREKRADLQEVLTNKYGHFKSVLEGFGGKVQHDASEAFRAGKEKVVEVAKDIDESVHKHPWQYIGGAALGALILGFLLGRSRK